MKKAFTSDIEKFLQTRDYSPFSLQNEKIFLSPACYYLKGKYSLEWLFTRIIKAQKNPDIGKQIFQEWSLSKHKKDLSFLGIKDKYGEFLFWEEVGNLNPLPNDITFWLINKRCILPEENN